MFKTKVRTRVFYLFLLITGTVTLFSACKAWKGGSFEPLNRQLERQDAISKNIISQFANKKEYVSIDFGDEYLIKPESYKPLDSLYALKYEESHYGGLNRAREEVLGKQIDSVLNKVLKDSVLFKYEINHVFALNANDSSEFISAQFLINHDDSIENVAISFQFKDKEKYFPYFIEFLKKRSFMYAQDSPSDQENDFYKFFETGLNMQIGAVRKGEFIDHILHVMKAANVQQSLKSELVIKQLIVDQVTQHIASYESIKWSDVTTELGDSSQLISYTVDHEWKYTGKDGKSYHLIRRFQLNPYFQISNITALDKIN